MGLRLTLWILGIFLFSGFGQAKTVSVTFEGIPSSKFEFYKSQIQNILKNKIDMASLQQAVSTLYTANALSNIEVYVEDNNEENQTITFKLFPKQTIRTIAIKGNSHFSKSDILAELGLSEGEKYTEDKIRIGIENVKKYYNTNGYLTAQVGAHFDQADAVNLTLYIDIEEGSPCLVDEIEIISPNSKLNREMKQEIKHILKKPLTQQLLNETQARLSEFLTSQRYYSSTLTPQDPKLNETRTKANLMFSVSEPFAFAIVFEGNSQFTEYQIFKELKLDESNRLSRSPVDDLKERVLTFYKSRGFATMTLKHRESTFTDDFVRRINFTITEGAKVKIKNIEVDGVFSRPPQYYSQFIFEHAGELIDSKYFNSEYLDNGIKNLVTELQNQGFIGAQVISTRVDFDKKKESVTVKINLNEGPQTFIDKVNFKGATKVDPAILQELIGLRAGGPLQLSALAEASSKITEHYRNLGYLDARVSDQTKNIITYSDENKKATLVFDIYEGPLISVSSVIVEGNFFTKDYIVLRELQFGVGETLTPEKISYSEVRLQRLALFDSIEIRTLTDDPNEGRRTVLVIVTEKKPGKFKGGLGADNELTLSLKGYVGAAYRNLFGTGRIINGRVEVSDKISNSWSFWEKEVTLGYTEPFALGTTNNLKLSGTYSNKLYSINSDSTAYLGQIVYALETIQGSLILERDLTRYLKLVYELYGIEKTKTYETMGRRPAIPIDIYTTGPTLILDKRDDVFNTKRGFMTSASTEYSSPALGSSDTVNYVKAVGDFSAYFPLGKTVLAQQVRSGYIWNLFMTSGTVIPQLKAFVLGGRSTIRGFNVTETVPRFSDLQNGLVSSNGAASYELFYLSKTEWRVPIVGNFGVAIFYDGGHIEYSNFTQNFFWRDSVGLGLRYNTPVGPVSIEYGYKLNRDLSRGETPGEFHFSIGVF